MNGRESVLTASVDVRCVLIKAQSIIQGESEVFEPLHDLSSSIIDAAGMVDGGYAVCAE